MNITINRKSNQSIADQIAESIQNAIDTSWYKVADKLPSIRRLSKELSVSPMTVVHAYEQLERMNYVEKIHGKGIYVSERHHYTSDNTYSDTKNRDDAVGNKYVQHLSWQDDVRDYVVRSRYAHRTVQFGQQIVNMSTAALHSRFLQTASVIELFRENQDAMANEFGRYPPVEGHRGFRREIHQFFTEKGLECSEEQILITSGSQSGIHLVAETFIGQGDVVIVGAPTFPGAIDVFKGRGAIVIEVPVDEDGMNMANLMAVCEQYPVKLVYIMATFQNPTGVCLSMDRCLELLELANEYNFMILEDDSWSELYFDGVMRPLKTFDVMGRVLYLGGFSKIFGPSFRLSGMIAEGSLYTRLIAAKSNIDSGAPLMNQLMLLPYMNSIERKQHHTWLCHELKGLRNRVVKKLHERMPSYVQYRVPSGGLVFWLKLPTRFDGKLLYHRCLAEKGISLLVGENCYSSIRGENRIRICYTYEEESVIMKSIEAIADLIQEIQEKRTVLSNPMF